MVGRVHGIVAGAVACLLAAGMDRVSAGNAQETLIGSGFELLDVVEAGGDPMGTVRTAADADSFQRLGPTRRLRRRHRSVSTSTTRSSCRSRSLTTLVLPC